MTKRDAILLAAERLFARDGFGLTGVDALAREAGVTKRTLYKQFGSKEGLFSAWLRQRDMATRAALLDRIEARFAGPEEQLTALFAALGSLSVRSDYYGCPFSRALIELPSPASADSSRSVASDHKRAIASWIGTKVQALNLHPADAVTEEIMLLYEGVLARIATTRATGTGAAAQRSLARIIGTARQND
jgi:AcrR family transcriptional regulator